MEPLLAIAVLIALVAAVETRHRRTAYRDPRATYRGPRTAPRTTYRGPRTALGAADPRRSAPDDADARRLAQELRAAGQRERRHVVRRLGAALAAAGSAVPHHTPPPSWARAREPERTAPARPLSGEPTGVAS